MKHDRFHIDLVRVAGRIELRHAGRTLRTVRDNGYADYYARVEEARLREAHATTRPCLSCGDTFPSLGSHNRLCDRCRRAA